MNKEEVIKVIGKRRWKAFEKFMLRQTIGLNPDGSFDYYECDVKNFLRKEKDRFFD